MRQKYLNKHYRLILEEFKERNEADALQTVVEELRAIVRRHERRAEELKKERDLIERKLCPVTKLPPKDESKKRPQKPKEVDVKDLTIEQLMEIAKKVGIKMDFSGGEEE